MNFGDINKFILFGGGELLKKAAQKLQNSSMELVVVLNRGCSKKLKAFLNEREIRFIVSEDVNKDDAVIEEVTDSTLGVSICFTNSRVFSEDFLSHFDDKFVNCHGAALPQNRGLGGYSWRIMRDDPVGVSVIHKVAPELDAGAVLKYREYFYPASCEIPADYSEFATRQEIKLLSEFIQEVKDNHDFTPMGQPEYLSSYWPRVSADKHGYINWSWDLEDIVRFIRAFDDPYPGAITFVNSIGAKVRLKKCQISANDRSFHPFQKGMIYRIREGSVFVAAGEGSLILKSVKDEGGADVIERLSVGDRFYTPEEHLEKAKIST